MTTVKVSMATPGIGGSVVTTEIEMIVDADNVEDSGREASRLITAFITSFVEETDE